jgi:hypothetical protein
MWLQAIVLILMFQKTEELKKIIDLEFDVIILHWNSE